MNEIDYKKIILDTLLKVVLMIAVVFLLNNWPQFKQSFTGKIPALNLWLDHSFKLSNLVLILFAGIYFFYKNLNAHKELAKKQSEQVENE